MQRNFTTKLFLLDFLPKLRLRWANVKYTYCINVRPTYMHTFSCVIHYFINTILGLLLFIIVMATAAKRLKRDFDDITECPICSSEFRNPKLLHCGHTFCLNFLEGTVRGKSPGDKIPCPFCREKFEIPADWITNLKTNFLISELIERKAFSVQRIDDNAVMCMLCNEESEPDPDKIVKWFCVYCGEKLCEQCRNVHKRQRLTKEHRVVEIGDEETKQMLNSKASFCEKHTSEEIKLYCFDCKFVICTICYAIEYENHTLGEVDTTAENQRQILRKSMTFY